MQSSLTEKIMPDDSYFDILLKDIDPDIKLDEDQRKAILFNDDHCLLIAGAGAGKTATMVAKVKYLVEKRGVKLEEILVFSYTRKAIEELEERINQVLEKQTGKISTFHAFGLKMITEFKGLQLVEDKKGSLENIISDFLKDYIYKNKKLLEKALKYFAGYFSLPDEHLKDPLKYDDSRKFHQAQLAKVAQDYESLKNSLGEYIKNIGSKREKENRTLTGEYLRSMQEVEIANFLYLNGLEYEYEPVFDIHIKKIEIPIPGSKKKYTPDFVIRQGENVRYLEHWALSESGTNDRFSPEEKIKYEKSMKKKRKHHEDHGSWLLQTYSNYTDGRPLCEHLREVLLNAGLNLRERNFDEVYKKIVETSEGKYIKNLVELLRKFIQQFKTNGYDTREFEILMEKTKNDPRLQLFLEIAKPVYEHYQKQLAELGKIDFDDMINEATKCLEEADCEKLTNYKYIIIDEFQDISKSRFNLTKRLVQKLKNVKIIAVGDDWQSIFAFAGSDITLFTQFSDLMGSGIEMHLTHTYRNSQELIDIAGEFVQKNHNQIKKKLKSNKTINQPIELIGYDDSNWNTCDINKAEAVEKIIKKIIKEYDNEEPDILLIGRYNFDLKGICNTGKFEYKNFDDITCLKYPKASISFLTVHRAKGLGRDHVILLNMSEGKFGFPCQIEDDPIMKLLRPKEDMPVDNDNIDYLEERRLFYVALTRTKNKVYILTPQQKPSRFLIELIEDSKIQCPEKVNMETVESYILTCPKCKYPIKSEKNKNYGMELFRCTNEPELCNFMANNEHLEDIYKCQDCEHGYRILMFSKNGNKFYGCTGYNESDRESGCKGGTLNYKKGQDQQKSLE